MKKEVFVQKGHYIFQCGTIDRCLGSFYFKSDCERIVNLLNSIAEKDEE